MNIAEIQIRLDAMPARMSAKGLRQPDACFQISANKDSISHFRHQPKDSAYGEYEWFKAGTIEERLDAMDAWIASLPSIEETRRTEFLTALAGCIELGRESGIDIEFVNPLLDTMKRLSENAITYREAA